MKSEKLKQVKTSTYMRHWPSMSWQNNFDWYQHPFLLAESVPRMIHVSYARGFCTIFIWFCFKFLLYPIHRISSLIIFKVATLPQMPYSLQWRHNERDGVSIYQPHDCLLKRLFRCRSKTTSKLRVTGLCVGNSPVTDELPAQRASNAENVSIWWRHHVVNMCKSTAMNITPRGVWIFLEIYQFVYRVNVYVIAGHYVPVWHQSITWAFGDPDSWRYMALLGHSGLI